jgi:hypothetical protein
MGQITEDIIDGSCCSECQCYFEHPKKDNKGKSVGIYVHDYPVVCWDCWDELTAEEKTDNTKADVKTF